MSKIAERLKGFAPEDMLMIAQGLEKPMKVLLALAKDYGRIYLERKQEKNILDFSDIEHYALSILVNKQEDGPIRKEAALQLRDQYAEILVDEYQDSNYLQEMILTAISGDLDGRPNMFMVGDIKQSIYRFRMARPEIFMKKYRTYSSNDSLYQKIDLQKNFRSRGDVLEGINRIFYRIMTESLGDVEYDDAAALYKGADYPPRAGASAETDHADPRNALKLVVVDVSKNAIAAFADHNDGDLDEEVESAAAEAYAAAREIRRIVDPACGEKVYDRDLGQNRPASYKDIVILLRSTTGRADKYLEILSAEGIPATAAAMGYFSAMEVRTMLSFLQIIDNPLQDIPLATVMKSVIGGFSSEELAVIETLYRETLRTHAAQADPVADGAAEEEGEPFRTGAFYDALVYAAQPAETEAAEKQAKLSHKCRAFLDMLDHYRYESDHREVYELIQIIYRETGYYDYVSAMPAGSVRRMNLDMLVQKAVDYEKTSYHGLFHFVRYMQHLEKYEVDFEQGQAFGEQDDIVRIYSIHKSKGLEYPIVILGGMAKYFNMTDSRARIMLHPDLGVAADYVDTDLRCRMSSIAAKAVSQKITADAMGEELRILYVAMTRAKEKLIMIGADRSLQNHIDLYGTMENHGEHLPLFRLISANSYLDWVMMGAGDQLENWMEVEFLNPVDVFTDAAVREAGKLEVVDSLRGMPRLKIIWDRPVYEKLARMDSLVYTYQESVEIQSKFSVSELKHEAADKALAALGEDTAEKLPELSEIHTVPGFMRAAERSDHTEAEPDVNKGALYGTYYHRVMELINPEKIKQISDVNRELCNLEAEEAISLEVLDLINSQKLLNFYTSDLGRRFTRAYSQGCLYREQPFILS
ncbi:MAG: UvrD-helicase domain-containing protein, partial [Lachnospiraceae bacterium]|nr:UvrD-helicase domain-containing protein [Lachnospiraceae bacterium]